jgi:FixJ family two-component response regulator
VTTAKGYVYIVDDDLPVRRAVARVLRVAGYKVATFSSAREFLAHGDLDHPTCLVLDVRMPHQDGFELLEALHADKRNIPIIFITGHGDIPMAVRAMQAGAVDFLTKPLDEQVLLDAVERAMSRARLGDAR